MVGGTGGIGRAIVRYLADLGAKHIITLSRSGGTSDSVLGLIQEMADRKIDLRVMKGSVVDLPTVEGILCTTKDHPVRGIIQAALILQVARASVLLTRDLILTMVGCSFCRHDLRAVARSSGS